MGFILGEIENAGEYHVEVRRESFYLSGSPNWTWSRIDPDTGDRVFWDADTRPEGSGWKADYFERRHSINLYQNGGTGQGTAEILLEDIPKIRAALDAVEAYCVETRGGLNP